MWNHKPDKDRVIGRIVKSGIDKNGFWFQFKLDNDIELTTCKEEETVSKENENLIIKKALSDGLITLLDDINGQIDISINEAAKLGCPPLQMRTTDGNWVIAPLLCAKAQVLSSLVLLEG